MIISSPPENLSSMRTGIICNPGSGRIRRQLDRIRKLVKEFPAAEYRETSSLDEIRTTIEIFNTAKVDLLVIMGGDGTVQKVLTELLTNRVFTKLPLLSVVPGGTTNMTASDLGTRGDPKKVLKRLLTLLYQPVPPVLTKRQVLCIEQETQSPVFGMFWGAGAIASGARYFDGHVKQSGVTGEVASALVILRLLIRLVIGQPTSELSPVHANISDDSVCNTEKTCLVLFATTMDRLLLGLRPYWGHEPAPIHTTWFTETPARLWRSLLSILCRRGDRLAEADGYYSRNNQGLELLMDGEFIVDGEFFMADSRNGPLRITANNEICFVSP